MGVTSWQSKAKYNSKVYKNYQCALKKAEYEIIDQKREELGMSKAEFLRFLFEDKFGKIDAENESSDTI